MAEQGEIQSERQAAKDGLSRVAVWIKHIDKSKADDKLWLESAKIATEIYEAAPDDGRPSARFNILHSNIETLVPALYNSTPVPDVRRRYNDKDPMAKQGVDIIERSVGYVLDQYDFDDVMTQAVKDSELAGRGTARLRYEPTISGDQIVDQAVSSEHVIWDKWGHGPARCWDDVKWIWFEHELSEDDLLEIGVEQKRIAELSFGDTKPEKGEDKSAGIFKTLKSYEIWDKRTRQVLWITPQDKDSPIKVQPDSLGLPGFFPMPEPIIAIRKRGLLRPLCPYDIYKPLVEELEQVTRRIAALIKQCRVRGLIDSTMGADLGAMSLLEDGQYAPVENAASFMSGGGLEKAIAHWPMEPTIQALGQLYVQREQVKQTIYEVTGLSDILRGATDANETLGAQQIKAQWGSQRIQAKQAEVARFARDLFRMHAHVICAHFQAQQLQEMTQIQVTPELDQMLKSPAMRGYRIDIESDSTVRADMTRTQEQMTQFMQSTGTFVQSVGAIAQTMPESMPVMVEIYTAFARKFKLGKQAEDALDGLSQLTQQAAQQDQQQPKPDPEAEKAQAEMAMQQAAGQLAQQKAQADMQVAEQKAQADMQLKQMDMQLKQMALDHQKELAALDLQMKQAELNLKQRSLDMDLKAKQADIATRERSAAVDLNAKRQEAAMRAKPKAEGGGGGDDVEKRLAAVERKKSINVVRDQTGQIVSAEIG